MRLSACQTERVGRGGGATEKGAGEGALPVMGWPAGAGARQRMKSLAA